MLLVSIFVNVNLLAVQMSLAQSYIGLGVSNLSSGSEYSAIDGKSGTGFTLYVGHTFASTWYAEISVSDVLEMQTGPTELISYPADQAEFGLINFSVRKNFLRPEKHTWSPWISAGISYHHINWDTYFYQLEGFGLSLSGGLEFTLYKYWHLRLKSALYRYSAYNNYNEGPLKSSVFELSASVSYSFVFR